MSVQWGAWHGVGMVASSEAVLSRMRRSGVSTVSPLAGLAALGAVLHSAGPAQVTAFVLEVTSLPMLISRVHHYGHLRRVGPCQVAAVPFVWKTFLQSTVHQPFYAEFLRHGAARQSSSRFKGVEPSCYSADSSNASASRHLGMLQLVLGFISTWIGGPVDPNMPLSQAGLDSLGLPGTFNALNNVPKSKHSADLSGARRP